MRKAEFTQGKCYLQHKNTENCKASYHLFAFLCGFVSFLDSIVLSCVFNWKKKSLKAGRYWDEMAVFFSVEEPPGVRAPLRLLLL